jgi:hypothetical protein
MARKRPTADAEIRAFARRAATAVTESVPGTVSYADAIADAIARACAEPDPEPGTDSLDTD